MTKTFFCGFTGFFLALSMTNIGYSQNSISAAKFKLHGPEKIILSSAQSDEMTEEGSLRLNEISAKAVRNFNKDYKNVTDVKWFESSNGLFVAHFISNDIKSRVHYDKKGNYEFMLRYYNEEKLPREVRHLVKSNYYDFNIYHVTEITINRITAYVVILEDKNSKNKIYWKIIKVVNGEMEVLQEYSQNIDEEN